MRDSVCFTSISPFRSLASGSNSTRNRLVSLQWKVKEVFSKLPTANSELNVGVTTLTDICVNVKGKGDVLLKKCKNQLT